jgi:HSP20 family protein
MRRNDEFLPQRREADWGIAPRRSTGFGGLGGPADFFSASPWQMMRRMQEDMDRVFGQFFGGPGELGRGLAAATQWAPSVDVSQSDREWIIEADLPGVRRDDIEAHVQNHHLILRAEMRQEEQPAGGQGPQAAAGQQGSQGQQDQQRQYLQRERRYGFFERVIPLPENVDEEQVRCEFRDGVLRVHLPKKQQAQFQGRRIPIGAGETEQTFEQAPPAVAGRTAGSVPSGGGQSQPAATTTNGNRRVATAGAKGGEKTARSSKKSDSSPGTGS